MVALHRNEEQLDRVFSALSDRTRRRMLARLRKRPLSITELARPFRMSFAGVAKHIDVLADAGLICKVRAPEDARSYRLELRAETLDQAAAWLEYHRSFWSTQLDLLERYIEAEKHGKPIAKARKKN